MARPQTPSSLSERFLYPLEAVGFAAIAGLTRALPVEQASALSGAAWRRFAPLNRRHARAAEQLARAMPELSQEQRAKILDGMWDNLGRTTAEAFHIEEIMADRSRIEFSPDLPRLIEKSREQGAIFVTLHLGNWELCAPIVAREGLDIAGLYQRIKNPHVDAAVIQMRSKYYRGGLLPKSAEAAREILRVASNHGTIGLLGRSEGFPRRVRTIFRSARTLEHISGGDSADTQHPVVCRQGRSPRQCPLSCNGDRTARGEDR